MASFAQYAGVVSRSYPEKAVALWGHLATVMSCQNRATSGWWRSYDVSLRHSYSSMERADFLLNQCLLMQAMVESSESLQRPTPPVPGPLAPQRQRKRRVQACFAWNDGRPCAAVPCRFSHCCARLGIMLGGFALLRLKRLLRRWVVVALTDRCPGTFCGYFVWNFVVR